MKQAITIFGKANLVFKLIKLAAKQQPNKTLRELNDKN